MRGCGGAAAVWEGLSPGSQIAPALVCSSVKGYFPNKQSRLPCANLFRATLYSQSAACLSSLLIICVVSQPSWMQDRLSVSQLVSIWVSQSVKSACCQIGSPGMNGREGLCLSCVRCCHHKPMLMSRGCSGSVWHLGILPRCHVALLPLLTNADWQNILSVFECGCRRLTAFWDVNE